MKDARTLKECHEVLVDALKAIDILADALEDCHAIAKANPLVPSSLAIKEASRKGIERALDAMDNHDG